MKKTKSKSLDERKLREINHSDLRRSIVRGYEYLTDASLGQLNEGYIEERGQFAQNFSNMKFYSITQSSVDYRNELLFDNMKGAVALDYCCGNGEVAIEMAKRGASTVVGIDISSVAVSNAGALARNASVDRNCEFRVMDAEHTDFTDDTFDIIHEYGSLHHLEFRTACGELSRILKPGGKLICTEALRHNPFIHLYRKRTPPIKDGVGGRTYTWRGRSCGL